MWVKVLGTSYKSFSAPFEWQDIPPFAVLVGPNGSGKSQLLELIAAALKEGPVGHGYAAGPEQLTEQQVQLVGPGTGVNNGPDTGMPDRINMRRQLRAALPGGKAYPIGLLADKVSQRLRASSLDPSSVMDADLENAIPLDAALYETLWQPWTLPERVARVFFDYYVRRKDVGGTEQEFINKYGRPPWDRLNELLDASRIGFRVNKPESLMADFGLRMSSSRHSTPLNVQELSTGEQRNLMTALLLYVSSVAPDQFPRVLLLDEPDAHLHTSLIPPFVSNMLTLVNKFQCHVLLATQRPDTIALVPEDALFEISADVPRIKPAESRASCLCAVADNLLSIGPLTRVVFVEDEHDVEFYQAVAAAMNVAGLLEKTPNFETASVGKGSGKIAGGVKNVYTWVRKFNDSGLGGVVQGVVDRDNANKPQKNVHVLERYSIENYLVDPLLIFCVLMDADAAPKIKGEFFHQGDEHRVATAAPAVKQAIVDAVVAAVESNLSASTSESEKIEIAMSDGFSLRYPKWLIDRQGRGLMGDVYGIFEGKVDRGRLLQAIRRLRLIPMDLLLLNKDILAAQSRALV